MCNILNVSKTYYYKVTNGEIQINEKQIIFDNKVHYIYNENRGIYGSRKIDAVLTKYYPEMNSSRYKVLQSMQRQLLMSKYCKRKKTKPYMHKGANINTKDKSTYENKLKQKFNETNLKEVLTSDLTYVQIQKKFSYICFIVDLYNREIVGFSVGNQHNTALVLEGLTGVDISKTRLFHSDRGGEFKGEELLVYLSSSNVENSYSKAGYPYDNAVSEKVFDIFKFEWMAQKYDNELELKRDVQTFVNWYNNFRVHGSLGYQTPVEKRLVAENSSFISQ